MFEFTAQRGSPTTCHSLARRIITCDAEVEAPKGIVPIGISSVHVHVSLIAAACANRRAIRPGIIMLGENIYVASRLTTTKRTITGRALSALMNLLAIWIANRKIHRGDARAIGVAITVANRAIGCIGPGLGASSRLTGRLSDILAALCRASMGVYGRGRAFDGEIPLAFLPFLTEGSGRFGRDTPIRI